MRMGAFQLILRLSFVLVLILCVPCLSQNQTVWYYHNDMSALESLWAAWENTPNPEINLAGWHAHYGNSSDYPCYNAHANWRGVSCLMHGNSTTSDSDIWVISLLAMGFEIKGKLPPEIGNLTSLVTLTITENPELTGPIPKELGNLTSLNICTLSGNNFNGTVPEELSNLQYIMTIDLNANQLTGQFPSQFGNTPTIQFFQIAQNHFYGPIPQQAFENMTQVLTLDIHGNRFTGTMPNLTMMSIINQLDISSNNFSGPLPNLSASPLLTIVNLSSSGLTGSDLSTIFTSNIFPTAISTLDLSDLKITGSAGLDWSFLKYNGTWYLTELYLDTNFMNGTLDLQSMANMNLIPQASKGNNNSQTYLKILSMQYNNITNVITNNNLIMDVLPKIYLNGNPYCTHSSSSGTNAQRCYCEQVCLIYLDQKSNEKKVIIIATTVSAAILIVIIVIALLLVRRSKKQILNDIMKKFNEADVNPKRFNYNDIRAATRNFNENMKLGAGAYGAVYKGELSNNNIVAVKQLFMKTQQASDEFINEIVLIINLQHRNLVDLKGYCINGKEMLLIYEYVDNYDLDKILFGTTRDKTWEILSWQARYKICLGVAHGLYYLHESSQQKIIHRDIKASNILLDKDLNPKIADFGLARPFLEDKSQIMTEQRVGTKGYWAPEYMMFGQLSEKTDVYSFGVLVLEIMSGKRNIDPTMPDDEVYLPNRAWKLYREDNLFGLLDRKLHVHNHEEGEVRRVLEIALMCVQQMVEHRPTMFHVVSMLKGDSQVMVTTDHFDQWDTYRKQIRESLELDKQHSGEPLLTLPPTNSSTTSKGNASSSSSSSRRGLFTNRFRASGTLELSDFTLKGGR